MIKNLSYLILYILCNSIAFNSYTQGIPKDSLSKVELFTGNKLMKKTEYIYSEGKINSVVVDYMTNDIYLTTFLLAGDTIYEVSTINGGYPDSATYYYENGRLKETTICVIPNLHSGLTRDKSEVAEIRTIKYTDKGDIYEIFSIHRFMSDTFKTVIEYEYSEDKLLVSKTYKTYQGTTGFFNRSFPQEKGEPEKIDSLFYDGDYVIRKAIYSKNKLLSEEQYIRDKNMKLIEYVTLTGTGESSSQKYEYKKKGKKTIKLISSDLGGLASNSINKYIYNKNNDLEEYVYINENKTLNKTIYKFDKKGRKIEELDFLDKEGKLVLSTKIVYTYF